MRSKAVDYEGFPIDTGTIIANNYLNPDGKLPLVIAANNVYHDWETTKKLAATTVACANKLGRRVALVGVGGLSGSIIREEIDLASDHIASKADDDWNRKMLRLIASGNLAGVAKACPKYAAEARVDMGFKHLAWILGGLSEQCTGAMVHAYGPSYGSGAAVVEFVVGKAKRTAGSGGAKGKRVARQKPAAARKPAAAKKPAARRKAAPARKKAAKRSKR